MFSKTNNSPSQAVPVALSRAQRLARFFTNKSREDQHPAHRMLTDLEFRRAIEQFRVTHATRTPTDALVIAWRVLRDLSPAEFQLGCRRYLADGTSFFPTPADIKRLARKKAPAPEYTAPHFYSDPLDEAEKPPFDKAAFREMLRDRAGIDLDGPKPLSPYK